MCLNLNDCNLYRIKFRGTWLLRTPTSPSLNFRQLNLNKRIPCCWFCIWLNTVLARVPVTVSPANFVKNMQWLSEEFIRMNIYYDKSKVWMVGKVKKVSLDGKSLSLMDMFILEALLFLHFYDTLDGRGFPGPWYGVGI